MNQFFSFRRFSLLVSKHWADNKRRYSLSVIGFVLLLIVWFIFALLVESGNPMSHEVQILTFFFTLFGTGAFYASQYFRDLGSRAKGINFLLVPASAFEKILCSLLFTIVIFFTVFTAAFYLVDALMVTVAEQFLVGHGPESEKGVINVFKAAVLAFDGVSFVYILIIFLTVQSLFVLGSVYFAKYSFVKTVIAGFVIFFVLFCLIYLLFVRLMPVGEYTNVSLTSYRIKTGGANDHLVQVPEWIGEVVRFALIYGIAPFLWVASYYRLKEKQV